MVTASVISNGPRQLQHHLGDDQGAEEGAGHYQDGDHDHLPALLDELLDLVADGHAREGAHHGQGRGEVDLPHGLDHELRNGGDGAGAQQAQDGAVGHRGQLQGNEPAEERRRRRDHQQHQHAGKGLAERHVKADEVGHHHAEAGQREGEDPFLFPHVICSFPERPAAPVPLPPCGPPW